MHKKAVKKAQPPPKKQFYCCPFPSLSWSHKNKEQINEIKM